MLSGDDDPSVSQGLVTRWPLAPLPVERLIGYLRVFGPVAGVPPMSLGELPEPWLAAVGWATLASLTVWTPAMWVSGQGQWS